MLKTEQFHELDQDTKDFFKSIEKGCSFSMDVKYTFQSNDKLKKLIEIKKLPDNIAVLLNSEVLVTVNEIFFDQMDEEINKILFEQEINKIHLDLEKGTVKIVQPDLKTTTGLVKKFSYDKIERAFETQRLLVENKPEKEEKIK